MKNFLVLFCLLAPALCFGQRFHAVAIAGFNAAQVDGDRMAGYHKLGFNGGAKVHAMLSDNFSLGVELLYAQKGARSRRNPYDPGDNLTIQLNYAEIPLLLHYHDKDRALFGLGVSYNGLLNYQIVEDGIDITNDGTVPPPSSRDINFLADLTFMIGSFGINGRFAYSIFPIQHWPSSLFKNQAVYNNVVSLRALYFF